MEPGEIVSSPETSNCGNEKETENTVNDCTTSNTHFTVDRTCIPTVSQDEQEKELCNLNIEVYQQEVLEKEILSQVDKALEEQKQKKAEELALQKEEKIQKKNKPTPSSAPENEFKSEEKKKEVSVALNIIKPEETERERKIRMGEMTPFGTVISLKTIEGNNLENIEELIKKQVEYTKARKSLKRKHIQDEKFTKISTTEGSPLKKKIFFPKKKHKKKVLSTETSKNIGDMQKRPGTLDSEKAAMKDSSGSKYATEESDDMDDESDSKKNLNKKRLKKETKKTSGEELSGSLDVEHLQDERGSLRGIRGKKELDDGNEMDFLKRIEDWEKNDFREELETQFRPLGGGFKMPLFIWNKLYNYQRVGVHWLWELNLQRCGGILGDEMGLGKTIQVIAFLIGLSVSKQMSKHGSFKGLGPVLIVCPTTVMHQWVKEFHQWWPRFRVALLHESGTYKGKRLGLIRDVVKSNGVLITSYVTCIQQSEDLLRFTWHYIILDEGHKVRNPDSQIASTVNMFRTPHRLILSGSPMQNNLKELWSLFNFIFPGKLGTLPVFLAEFAVPITQGGYANASKVQVATAFKCATVLRDTISPYLLRRVKEDVKSHINLPPKNEQVLFCRLTEEQKELYVSYLNSGKVDDMLSGRYKIFVGLIELRKICNHPHLYTGGPKLFKWDYPNSVAEEESFGYWKKAGKMIVVETLLKMWKKQGHRVLIFSQSRQMLRILEVFVQSQNYNYIKIDGTTNIGSRQPLINKFNEDKKYYIFLSTTHVGGLGVNLTGANRVVIYDPDWNPATDMQARERAWRIGQENQVTIYRLVTSGTIEEKIYHRQIFKQFLTNKVLKDPSQRRFFKSNDLYELFTYKDSDNVNETSAIFAGTGYEVNLKDLTHRQKIKKIKDKMDLEKNSVKGVVDAWNILTKEKIEKMKQMAQSLSRKITLEAINKKEERISSEEKKANGEVGFSMEVLKTEESAVVRDKRKEKRKKHKRKKKKKDVAFDGEVVPHLQKQMQYRDLVKEVNNHEANDDYILKKLLSKSGVQSALRHDQIMGEESADYALVEGEAEKVAKEAVRALKESRKFYSRSFEEPQPSSNVPKPRFGKKTLGQKPSFCKEDLNEKNTPMTSSELLQRIRQRNGLSPSISKASNNFNEHSEILTDVRNFISFGGQTESKATTQEIVSRFRDRLPAGQTPLFKALLNEICEFRRSSSGEGVWELRSEFRCVGIERMSQKDSKTSSDLQPEECDIFWLARGPPFSEKDYMISPSESTETLVIPEKTKFSLSNFKIDSKYLLTSRQALETMLKIIRDGHALQLVNRLKDLIYKFLEGTPQGFYLEEIPIVVEIVEYFCRNRGSAPEFEDFVKVIMCFANGPPKLNKSSDVVNCKEILADYFTLLGEMLATFQDELYQLNLLKTLYTLLSEEKVFDLTSARISLRFEGMEESQLPYTVASLMETAPCHLYGYYLELAVHKLLMSVKAGCGMIQGNALNFVLMRLDCSPECKHFCKKSGSARDIDEQLYEFYRFLENSSFLIWGLLSIATRENVEVPLLNEKALKSLRNVLIREAKRNNKKGNSTRANLAAVLFKLCALFGTNKLPLIQTGLAVDITRLAVATEIKVKDSWVAEVEFGTEQDDFNLKKIMLLGCCLLTKNSSAIEVLKNENVIQGILLLINEKTSVSWFPSQMSNILMIGLLALSELVPFLPEDFVKNKGSATLLSSVKKLMRRDCDRDFLLETLRTLCVIATCENNKSIVEDFQNAGGINFLLDTAISLLQNKSIKMEHQEKMSRILVLLEKFIKNNKKNQNAYAEVCVSVSLKLFKRILENFSDDSKWSPIILVSFGGFLWEAVAWCQEALKLFIEEGGVFLILDLIESSCYPVQMLFLGVLVDMTDEGETIAHLLTWRDKHGYGILNLMIGIWKFEEYFWKVQRDSAGLIGDVESPLMTGEQWYLTHQVRDAHIYSPSIAEMVSSSRPKIHALYQFLQNRHSALTRFTEDVYSIQLEAVEPSNQVYIPLIQHYLAMKMGEIWYEVLRDATISGVNPTSFDGELLCTLFEEKNKWALRIKTIQEEILLFQQRKNSGSEQGLYKFLKSCQLSGALEAANELDYVARTSYKKFQKYRREKRMKEVEDSLAGFSYLNDVNIHRLMLCQLNATHFVCDNIFVKSEKEVASTYEDIPLVSPETLSLDAVDLSFGQN